MKPYLQIPTNGEQLEWMAEKIGVPVDELTGAMLKDWLVAGNSLAGLPSNNRAGRKKRKLVLDNG